MINRFYLEKESQETLRKAWIKDKHLSLQGFLNAQAYSNLKKVISVSKRQHVRIADKYSYSIVKNVPINDFFVSEEFLLFLGKLLGKEITTLDFQIKEFGWKNYTLLHDSEKDREKIQLFFFIPSLDKWDYFWGGNRIYHLNEGKGKSLVFPPKPNTLNIIAKGRKDLSFTQYLNHYVGNERVAIVDIGLK